jgi:hypothetical protein
VVCSIVLFVEQLFIADYLLVAEALRYVVKDMPEGYLVAFETPQPALAFKPQVSAKHPFSQPPERASVLAEAFPIRKKRLKCDVSMFVTDYIRFIRRIQDQRIGFDKFSSRLMIGEREQLNQEFKTGPDDIRGGIIRPRVKETPLVN